MTTRLQAMRHREVTDAVHDEGGAIALQVLHAGRYGYHPLSVGAVRARSRRSRRSGRPRCRPRGVDRTATDFARSVGLARKAGYDAVEIMGSEGYLINQFLAARTNDRTDAWGGRAENRMRFPRRGRAPGPRAGRPRLPDRLPDLAARPGRGRPDLGRGRRARARARGRRGHRAQHRHRLARGAGADDHHPGPAGRLALGDRAAQGRGVGPGLRVQPDQHPRAGRVDPRRRRGRPGVDGPAAAGRPGLRRQGRRRAAPTRSTPASPATRPASTTRSRTRRPPAWSTRGPAARPTLVLLPVPTQRRRDGRRRRRRAGRARRRGLRGRARLRGHAVRAVRRRSAASSGWRCRSPARRTSPRRCATTPAGSRCSASTCGSAPRPTAADLAAYDEVVVATGVVPRMPELAGHRPPEGRVVRRRARPARSSPAGGSP